MRRLLLLCGILSQGMAFAATPVDGWYSSVFGGYTYVPENITLTVNNIVLDGVSYNNGFNAGGRVGFQSNPIRYELEYTYLNADVKAYYVDNVRQNINDSGSTSASLGMANIYYDLPDMLPCVSPFLGVGIGYAYIESRLQSEGPSGFTYFKASDSVFAYQATTGFTYNFSENYALNLSYRYVSTDRADDFGKVYQAHIASLGGVYRFDQNSYK